MSENAIKYTLKAAVKEESGAVLSEVTLREPTVDDMIAVEEAGGTDLVQTVHLLRRMSGLSTETFGKIRARDVQGIKKLTDTAWGNAEEDGDNSPS